MKLQPEISAGHAASPPKACDLVQMLRLSDHPTIGVWHAQFESEFRQWLDWNTPEAAEAVPASVRINQMHRIAALFARGVIKGACNLGNCFDVVARLAENCLQDDITADTWCRRIVDLIRSGLTIGSTRMLPLGWDENLENATKEEFQIDFGEDDVCQSFQQIVARFEDDIEDAGDPDSEKFNMAMTRALTQAARSTSLLDSEVNRIIRTIHLQSRRVYTVSLLKARLKEIRQAGSVGEFQQQIVSSLLRDIEQYGELRYDQDIFWQYTGAYWKKFPYDPIYSQIAFDFGALSAAKKYNDHVQIRLLLATNVSKKLRSPAAPLGINFVNGFLTDSGRLIDHAPDHGMTYCLPFSYRPDSAGKTPMFDSFLQACWGTDPDYTAKVSTLQEIIGTTLMGKGPRFQRAILLHGSDTSGPSDLIQLVTSLLPPGTKTAVGISGLKSDRSLGQLAETLFNFAGEPTGKFAGDIFKSLVDGTSILVDRKYKDPYEIRPKATHWFSSNSLPGSDDWSNGFSRRWVILQFNQDKLSLPHSMREIAEREAEAIVAWAVQGYLRARDSGITLPASHYICVEQMRADISPLYRYLRDLEVLRIGRDRTDAATDATTLLHDYWNFCRGLGIRHKLSMPDFLYKMKEFSFEMGFDIIRENRTIFFKHIELNYRPGSR